MGAGNAQARGTANFEYGQVRCRLRLKMHLRSSQEFFLMTTFLIPLTYYAWHPYLIPNPVPPRTLETVTLPPISSWHVTSNRTLASAEAQLSLPTVEDVNNVVCFGGLKGGLK